MNIFFSFNNKKFLISFSFISFIFCANEPIIHNFEYEKPENMPIIINSNIKKNYYYLNFANSGCNLYREEIVEKYIFSEEGDEQYFQEKYINKGNLDNCGIYWNLSTLSCNISDVKFEGANNIKKKLTSDILEYNFNLKSNKYAILTYKCFYKYNYSKFYRKFNANIKKGIKYIFRARQPFEISGIGSGRLKEGKQKNGASYYYYSDSKYNFNEIIYLSAYGIKFKSELSVTLDFTIGRLLRFITVPNLHEFGNNNILSNEVLSNLKSNEYIVENNDKRFITIKPNEENKNRHTKFSFTFSKEFESKLDNEWIMDGVDLVNNCTTKIKNKVLEILSNKNSQEKDYVILGKWVYENIKYNLDYKNEKWTVDQILDKKVGVCSHKTRLYNAFLNCINIDAVYTKGYAHTSNNTNIDLDSLHAWTVAKIDGKWVPLDATWNIFNKKLHLGHIFRYYGDFYREIDADWGIFDDILSNAKTDMNILSSNPKTNLKINALSFLSREIEDDDEGDFKLKLDNYNYINIAIISLISVFLITVIIIAGFIYFKNKKKIKNSPEQNLALTIN